MGLFGEPPAGPKVRVQKTSGLTVPYEARPLRALCIGGLAEDLPISPTRVMEIIKDFK